MDSVYKIIMVGIVVMITHCFGGITGFGCSILALPFIVMLVGVKTAVPVLVVLSWMLSVYIILRSWKHISWKEFGFIILFVGSGLPVGIVLFNYCPEKALLAFLSVFMVGVGMHGFYKNIKHKSQEGGVMDVTVKPVHNWVTKGILLLGGLIHGAFGTGSPFVVIYATKALPQKALFRVTLCLLWFCLNSIMMVKWSFSDNIWNETIIYSIFTALPFLTVGVLLGDWLHHRVNEFYFRLISYLALALSGFSILMTKL